MDQHSISDVHAEKKSFIPAKTISICLILLLIAFVAISVFRVPAGTLFFAGALLACPLLHLWMTRGEHCRTMKDGVHKH